VAAASLMRGAQWRGMSSELLATKGLDSIWTVCMDHFAFGLETPGLKYLWYRYLIGELLVVEHCGQVFALGCGRRQMKGGVARTHRLSHAQCGRSAFHLTCSLLLS